MANYYEEEIKLFYEQDYTAKISFIFSFPKQFCIYGQQKYIRTDVFTLKLRLLI